MLEQKRWVDVESIGAFKRKDGEKEFVCVWVRTNTGEFPVEFDARDPKWEHFIAEIATELAGSKPTGKWFPEPLHPSLEINFQNVYQKGA